MNNFNSKPTNFALRGKDHKKVFSVKKKQGSWVLEYVLLEMVDGPFKSYEDVIDHMNTISKARYGEIPFEVKNG